MKFIVSSNTLSKHLQSIAGVLPSNPTIPILECFLFQIEGKDLLISASDLESTMLTRLEPAMIDNSGSVAIPAKILLETLKTFPEQPLTFQIDAEHFGVEISSDNGKYKLSGQNGDEFPKVPHIEDASKVEIPSDALFNGVNKCLFATSNDEMRPMMTGVFFEFKKNSLTFVATDAHKLVRYTRTDLKSPKEASFIMPKKPLNLLKNTLSNIDGKVNVEYNAVNVHFFIGDLQLITRLIDGKYPDYQKVIPKENPNVLTIERSKFLSSIKRVAIFSNKTSNQVRLKLAGSEIHISAEDLDFSNEANERLDCAYVGEDLEIGFNSRFIQEMLSNIDTETVKLEMSTPNKAGILLPNAEKPDENEDILMLVMPVMLSN
jgi:DNA polymerase-3 subunit beta